MALAVAMRLPEFTTIPPPTDETDELLWAMAILRDGARPLSASDPYIGPLASYLTAAVFALAGPSLAAGRAVSLALGALAAPAAWVLGRALGGAAAGLASGLVLAVAFGPIVLGSHVAWSHGGAVAFTAIALAGMVRATGIDAPSRRLAWATGAAAGLAVAAHPTVAALVPGAAFWWWRTAHGRLWPRGRAVAWAGLGGALAYAPILALGLIEGPALFREAAAGRDYVGAGINHWPVGVATWLESLARNLAGPAGGGDLGPAVTLAGIAIGSGLLVAVRRGLWLPLAITASGALLMPLMVTPDKFASLTGLRYAAPVLPAAAAAMGVAIGPRLALWWGRRPGLVAGCVLVAAALPMAAIGRYYSTTRAGGVTGAPVLAVVEQLSATQASGGVFIDSHLDTKLAGGGEVGRAVGALLTLRGMPYEKAQPDKIRWFLVNGDGASYDMVLSQDTAEALGSEFALVPVREVAVVPGQVSRSGPSWGLFRYTSPARPN